MWPLATSRVRLPSSPATARSTSGGGGLVSTAADYFTFASALLAGGTRHGARVLSRPSVTLMTSDHLTPAQQAFSGFPPYFQNFGWGFGMSVRTRRTHLGPSVGSYGWERPRHYLVHRPCRRHDDDPHDAAGGLATVAADLRRLLDGCLPSDRRLIATPRPQASSRE